MIENFTVAKSLLEQNGELIGTTSGNSMSPLFRSGKDKAVIIPLITSPKVNDVLLYRKKTSDDLVLHRVIKITDNGPVLRGDALYRNETNIPSHYILGVLKGFYRNSKYYDCKKSALYMLYTIYIRASYPLRYCTNKAFLLLKRILCKLKNLLEK